jgi:hypothetical protein
VEAMRGSDIEGLRERPMTWNIVEHRVSNYDFDKQMLDNID